MTDADLRTDREALQKRTACFSDSTMNWYYYGYHNPNQISVAQDWQNAVSLHSYTSFPVVSSEG